VLSDEATLEGPNPAAGLVDVTVVAVPGTVTVVAATAVVVLVAATVVVETLVAVVVVVVPAAVPVLVVELPETAATEVVVSEVEVATSKVVVSAGPALIGGVPKLPIAPHPARNEVATATSSKLAKAVLNLFKLATTV
jgi:hypothetical protein